MFIYVYWSQNPSVSGRNWSWSSYITADHSLSGMKSTFIDVYRAKLPQGQPITSRWYIKLIIGDWCSLENLLLPDRHRWTLMNTDEHRWSASVEPQGNDEADLLLTYFYLSVSVTAVPQSNWRRLVGRPYTSWMATLKNDLAQHNLTLEDAMELTLDKPLWRLLAASGATHWWCMPNNDDDDDVCRVL